MGLSQLPVLAGALAFGMLLADAAAHLGGDIGALGLAALQGAIAGALVGAASRNARPAATFGLVCAVGFLLLAAPLSSARFESRSGGVAAVVAGRVCGASERGFVRSRTLCAAVSQETATRWVRKLPSKIRVTAHAGRPDYAWLGGLALGESVRLALILRRPRSVSNPGARSWHRTLARRGIGAEARLTSVPLGVLIGDAGNASNLEKLRSRIVEQLATRGPGGALVAALVVGSRRDLDERTTEAFRALGLSHLLAISGLHVASVAALAYVGLAFVLRRVRGIAAHTDTRKGAALGALLAAGLYALVGGWEIPLQRAVLLLAIALLVGLLGRRPPARNALSAVLIVVLALDPAALFELGAQLSFAATAGLCLARAGARGEPANRGERGEGIWVSIARRSSSWTGASLRVSATAVLATTPILAAHGVAMSGFTLLANLVALPLFGFVVLPLALIAGALAGLDLAPWIVENSCEVVGAFEALVVGTGLPAEDFLIRSPAGTLAFALTSLLALAGLACRGTRLRVCAALASLGVVAALPALGIDVPRSSLLALDVGRGDALLLRAGDALVMIDAGSHPPGNPAAGNRAVLRALDALGIERIDLLVASHADLDHRGGLPALVDRLVVGEIWVPPGGLGDPDLRGLVAAAQRREVPLRERSADDAPVRVGGFKVATLWPLAGADSRSRNERSLVTRIEIDGVRVLLPADIGARSEARLVEAGIDLEADVLLLGHHGSRGSTTPRFLEAISPRLAVVSAPCTSRGGLPHAETLRRVREADSDLWWTGRDGAVFVSLTQPLAAWAWRDPRQRPACGPD